MDERIIFKHWQINCDLILVLLTCFSPSFLREEIETSSKMYPYFTTFHSFKFPDSNDSIGCYTDNIIFEQIKNETQKWGQKEKTREALLQQPFKSISPKKNCEYFQSPSEQDKFSL